MRYIATIIFSAFLFLPFAVASGADTSPASRPAIQKTVPMSTTARPSAKPSVKQPTGFKKQLDAQAWLKGIGYNWTLEQMQTKTSLNLQKYSQQTAQLITDNNMVHLQQLPKLYNLRVHRGIGDAGVAHLAGKNFSIFNMPDSKLTDKGLATIGTFTGLTQLMIPSHSGVTDAGISKLMNIEHLFILNLTRTNITDASMPFIAKNKHLNKLFLSFTGITDAAIPTLINLNKIERLDIQGTGITPAGVAQLKAAHPGWTIMYP